MKKGSSDECTGLGDFQDLLGRLHGKSEESIRLEQKARLDHKIHIYVERKYGGMRFVRGGLLVGDTIESEVAFGGKTLSEHKVQPETRESIVDLTSKDSNKGKNKSKIKRSIEATGDEKICKRSKRQKKDTSGAESDYIAEPVRIDVDISLESINRKSEEAGVEKVSKRAKKGGKEERRLDSESRKAKKSKKQKSKQAKNVSVTQGLDEDESKREKKKSKKQQRNIDEKESSSEAALANVEPTQSCQVKSGTSTPQPQAIGARRFHRTKFIAQKRAAMMDASALNQILMIKPAAAA